MQYAKEEFKPELADIDIEKIIKLQYAKEEFKQSSKMKNPTLLSWLQYAKEEFKLLTGGAIYSLLQASCNMPKRNLNLLLFHHLCSNISVAICQRGI